jgi:hypothetical protein
MVEPALALVVNRDTGRSFSDSCPCVERGATVGYHSQAQGEAVKAMKNIPDLSFKLSP